MAPEAPLTYLKNHQQGKPIQGKPTKSTATKNEQQSGPRKDFDEPIDYRPYMDNPNALMWPPPYHESMEETFRKMSIAKKQPPNESYVKELVDCLFLAPGLWQESE